MERGKGMGETKKKGTGFDFSLEVSFKLPDQKNGKVFFTTPSLLQSPPELSQWAFLPWGHLYPLCNPNTYQPCAVSPGAPTASSGSPASRSVSGPRAAHWALRLVPFVTIWRDAVSNQGGGWAGGRWWQEKQERRRARGREDGEGEEEEREGRSWTTPPPSSAQASLESQPLPQPPQVEVQMGGRSLI